MCVENFRLGLNSLLNEVIDQNAGADSDEEPETEKPAPESAEGLSAFDALKAGLNSETNEDGLIKAQDDAIDYSDINELSEDCPRTPSPPSQPSEEAATSASTYDDLEDAIPATKVEAKSSKCPEIRSEIQLNSCICFQTKMIRSLCRRLVRLCAVPVQRPRATRSHPLNQALPMELAPPTRSLVRPKVIPALPRQYIL